MVNITFIPRDPDDPYPMPPRSLQSALSTSNDARRVSTPSPLAILLALLFLVPLILAGIMMHFR